MKAEVASLHLATAKGRPVAMAGTRKLEVPGALGGLFPEGGIRRGSSLTVGSPALALALIGAATAEGAWVAAVGLPTLGLLAAAEMGVRLDRLALVPEPGERWPAVAAAFLDGVDLLLLGVPGRARVGDARKLAARAREQGTVLMVMDPGGCWPDAPDLRLSVVGARWEGLGVGHGHLGARLVEVVVSGRRAAARERRLRFWLPGWDGAPAPAAPVEESAGEVASVG